jgi:hypothetical protein
MQISKELFDKVIDQYDDYPFIDEFSYKENDNCEVISINYRGITITPKL